MVRPITRLGAAILTLIPLDVVRKDFSQPATNLPVIESSVPSEILNGVKSIYPLTLAQEPQKIQQKEEQKVAPPVLFTFDKRNFVVRLEPIQLIRKNIEQIRQNLDETCADYKDFEIPAYLNYRVQKFNWTLRPRSKFKKLILGPIDERETKPPIKLQESPEIIRESNPLVKFGFPVKYVSNDQMDIDVEHTNLRKYTDPRDGKDKDGIVLMYTFPDPDGERILRAEIVPADIETIVIRDDAAYYIDVKRAIKPEKKEEKKKENEPRRFASGYLLNSNS